MARVDLSSGKAPRAKKVWVRPRFESESIATLVDATYRLGPKRGGKVWVASTDFWTGTIGLPSDISSALAGDELKQAVALEAETFSGISSFDSQAGTIPLSGQNRGEQEWWVTQIPNGELNTIESTIRSCGATFAGALHPALAIAPTQTLNSESTWLTIQSWNELTVLTRGRGPSFEHATVLNGSLESERVQLDIGNYIGSISSLASNAITTISDRPLAELDFAGTDPTGPSLRVDIESGLEIWGSAVGAAIASSKPNIPILAAERKPFSTEARVVVMALFAILAAAGCAGHHWMLNKQLNQTREEVAELEKKRDSVEDAKKRLATAEKSVSEQSTKNETLKSEITRLQEKIQFANKTHQENQNRWVDLIDSLQTCSDEKCWVRNLESSEKEATITGVAISNESVNRFASKLETALTKRGWKIAPAKTDLNEKQLFDFEIQLRPTLEKPKANNTAPLRDPSADLTSIDSTEAGANHG